jgi:hypothetical protein
VDQACVCGIRHRSRLPAARALSRRSVPRVVLTFNDDAEEKDVIEGRAKFDLRKVWPARPRRGCIGCIIGVFP